jgi:hypothetical protein
MKDFPSAISMTTAGRNRQQLYVFVRSDDDNLHSCFYDYSDSSWKWVSLGRPPGRRLNSAPSAVQRPALGAGGSDVADISVRGSNGHLFLCRWSGRAEDAPTWRDLGMPTWQADVISHPAAVVSHPPTTVSGPGFLETYCWSGDDTLFNNEEAQGTSSWHFLGQMPNNVTVAGDPGVAVGTGRQLGNRWAFVIGNDRGLYVSYPSNQWRAFGKPGALSNGLAWLSRPSAIFDPTRNDPSSAAARPSAYVVGEGRLWELSWTETRYDWTEIVKPASVTLTNSPSSVIYTHESLTKPYVFTIASSRELYVATLESTSPRSWFFDNLTAASKLPPLSTRFRRPAALVHEHEGPYIYIFAISQEDRLVVCFWDLPRSQWKSADLGRPATDV